VERPSTPLAPALVSHVSTGATGNTPVGRWHVYSKVPGWLPDGMFDSSFFLRGFAIHGYPTVPFYPGSRGCVRVPVWFAPRIYGYDPPGSTIYIYANVSRAWMRATPIPQDGRKCRF
jgi:lipoprotein-anchoring transpeptidase ErfK/SrfK